MGSLVIKIMQFDITQSEADGQALIEEARHYMHAMLITLETFNGIKNHVTTTLGKDLDV